MRVVTATKKDLDDIVRLNAQFSKVFKSNGKIMPPSDNVKPEDVLKTIQNGDFYNIKANGTLLGTMSLYVPDFGCKTSSRIVTLAVAPKTHGQGIGTKLVDYAKTKSQKAGMSTLLVGSYCLLGVKDFYLKCGFKQLPNLERYEQFWAYSFYLPLR